MYLLYLTSKGMQGMYSTCYVWKTPDWKEERVLEQLTLPCLVGLVDDVFTCLSVAGD